MSKHPPKTEAGEPCPHGIAISTMCLACNEMRELEALVAALTRRKAATEAREPSQAALDIAIRWGTDNDGIIELARRIDAALTATRDAARNEAREACDAVAREGLPGQHWDVAQERRSLWYAACARIKERLAPPQRESGE